MANRSGIRDHAMQVLLPVHISKDSDDHVEEDSHAHNEPYEEVEEPEGTG